MDIKAFTQNLKKKNEENFPVGSFLLPKNIRKEIHAFYHFVRLADDIADHKDLPPKEKLKALKQIEAQLPQTDPAQKYAKKLLSLFKKEAKHRHPDHILIQNWEDLINYCKGSANPVGRFLIDLHHESNKAYEASDALCTLLQILNHIQDGKKDWEENRRSYIPKDWWREASTPLYNKKNIKKMLTHSRPLLKKAETLPQYIKNKRFRIEIYFILAIAKKLHKKLYENSSYPYRIKLSISEKCLSFIKALKGFFNVT